MKIHRWALAVCNRGKYIQESQMLWERLFLLLRDWYWNQENLCVAGCSHWAYIFVDCREDSSPSSSSRCPLSQAPVELSNPLLALSYLITCWNPAIATAVAIFAPRIYEQESISLASALAVAFEMSGSADREGMQPQELWAGRGGGAEDLRERATLNFGIRIVATLSIHIFFPEECQVFFKSMNIKIVARFVTSRCSAVGWQEVCFSNGGAMYGESTIIFKGTC